MEPDFRLLAGVGCSTRIYPLDIPGLGDFAPAIITSRCDTHSDHVKRQGFRSFLCAQLTEIILFCGNVTAVLLKMTTMKYTRNEAVEAEHVTRLRCMIYHFSSKSVAKEFAHQPYAVVCTVCCMPKILNHIGK